MIKYAVHSAALAFRKAISISISARREACLTFGFVEKAARMTLMREMDVLFVKGNCLTHTHKRILHVLTRDVTSERGGGCGRGHLAPLYSQE